MVHIPGLDVVVNQVHYVTVPCPIRPFEDVLVEVHDEVDGARYLHVDVAVTQQQQMSIVWHDVSVLCTSPTVVYVSSVVCVCPVHDGLRKLLSTSTLVVTARLRVMVYHVPKHEFSIALVICFGRHGRNLSTDNVVDLVRRLRLRSHTESQVSMRQASLLKLHDVHQVDFPTQQASPQSIHQVCQLGSEDPTGQIGAITCLLAVQFGMVSNLRPIQIVSDRDEVGRFAESSNDSQSIGNQPSLHPRASHKRRW